MNSAFAGVLGAISGGAQGYSNYKAKQNQWNMEQQAKAADMERQQHYDMLKMKQQQKMSLETDKLKQEQDLEIYNSEGARAKRREEFATSMLQKGATSGGVLGGTGGTKTSGGKVAISAEIDEKIKQNAIAQAGETDEGQALIAIQQWNKENPNAQLDQKDIKGSYAQLLYQNRMSEIIQNQQAQGWSPGKQGGAVGTGDILKAYDQAMAQLRQSPEDTKAQEEQTKIRVADAIYTKIAGLENPETQRAELEKVKAANPELYQTIIDRLQENKEPLGPQEAGGVLTVPFQAVQPGGTKRPVTKEESNRLNAAQAAQEQRAKVQQEAVQGPAAAIAAGAAQSAYQSGSIMDLMRSAGKGKGTSGSTRRRKSRQNR